MLTELLTILDFLFRWFVLLFILLGAGFLCFFLVLDIKDDLVFWFLFLALGVCLSPYFNLNPANVGPGPSGDN